MKEFIKDSGETCVKLNIDHFIPSEIFECGQCFRWDADENGVYTGVAMGRAARVYRYVERIKRRDLKFRAADPVPPGRLRVIERDVRVGHEVYYRAFLIGHDGVDPYAYGYLTRLFVDGGDFSRLDAGAYFFGHHKRAVRVRIGQEHDEFLAAPARREVHRTLD